MLPNIFMTLERYTLPLSARRPHCWNLVLFRDGGPNVESLSGPRISSGL